MAKLVFYYGTMNTGKSTLALQLRHNSLGEGRRVPVFTKRDREGRGTISTRLGISAPAIEVTQRLDLYHQISDELKGQGGPIGLIIADEAQFYHPKQIEQLAKVVDHLGIDVYALGLLTDSRSLQFPGSKRLVELADAMERIQARALCWCGQPASQNARVIDGKIVTTGPQVMVGDTEAGDIQYRVLCRKHFFQGQASAPS